MPVEIIMPKLGLTMQEGKILDWKVNIGQHVEKGQVIFELETEKIVYEVESPATGVLSNVFVSSGETALVGSVVGCILLEGEEYCHISKGNTNMLETESLNKIPIDQENKVGDDSQKIAISPIAKKIALEKEVDINSIKGSGPSGRIVKEDVLRIIEIRETKEPVIQETTPVQIGQIIKLSSMRQTIAKRMSQSFYTAPHIYLTIEVDAGELIKLREDLLQYIEKQCGKRPSITDLLIKTLAKLIKEFPLINSSWAEEGIIVNKNVNIGIATAIEDGLLVPVISEADKKTLQEITSLRTDLTQRAKERKLTPDELKGGTFTLSNLGMYGIDFFNAIINPPESVILAVGATKEKPQVYKGNIVIRRMMYLTLSADHRIVDGAYAAEFLRKTKEFIEKPILSFQ